MTEDDLELGIEVQRTLDGRIRPLLNVDAGDIEIISVENGRVSLGLLGGCARCVLKLGCQAEMVLPTLHERFGSRGATFSVRGVPDHVGLPSDGQDATGKSARL
jgi:Fe-S cluster biogenesis protein NfuA